MEVGQRMVRLTRRDEEPKMELYKYWQLEHVNNQIHHHSNQSTRKLHTVQAYPTPLSPQDSQFIRQSVDLTVLLSP